jgi:prepilin-type N-terminal cleavage/methylation domain-containing protein
MPNDGKPGGQAGWTLIEVIFALFLFGLLAALCVPAVMSVGERVERKLLIEELATQLQLAQMEAVTRQAEVTVQWEAKEVKVIEDGTLLRKMDIPPPYRLDSNYPGQRLTFRETGQVRGGTVTFYVKDKPVGRIVIQVASGLPMIEVFVNAV